MSRGRGKNEKEEGKTLEKNFPFIFIRGKMRDCSSIDLLEKGIRTRAD